MLCIFENRSIVKTFKGEFGYSLVILVTAKRFEMWFLVS